MTIHLLIYSSSVFAQKDSLKPAPPLLSFLRAEESYEYLKSPESNPYQKGFADALKLIPITKNKSVYFTLGGEYRARLEHFTNQNWTDDDETYYSQRLSIHTSLQLGQFLRVFAELYHGFTSNGDQLLDTDIIDLHQGFIEIKAIYQEHQKLVFRFGRQEIGYGVSRLIGIREGPNMRRSFDLGRLKFIQDKKQIEVFYGKEVSAEFNAFDNRSGLFDGDATNPEIWGIYSQAESIKNIGKLELYYFGFKSKLARFSDVLGEEIRHTLGIRHFGNIHNKFTFNTELIYQFGDLGGSTIKAFNLETDWKYIFSLSKWKPTLGIKFDWSSGDSQAGDSKIQTFNPMFVNPAVYSLAAVNTPANLTSFHPNFTFYPAKGVSINLDYALFYRTQKGDGLYAPPRFQTREANGIADRHIGDVIGLQIDYQAHRNISLNLRSSYFIAGDFIKASGTSENTFYIAPTLSLKF